MYALLLNDHDHYDKIKDTSQSMMNNYLNEMYFADLPSDKDLLFTIKFFIKNINKMNKL
jgi:hypothetical protein